MIVTLTSDFGLSDGYVAEMKGVILRLAPQAILVDITHQIPPFDIAHAAFVLAQAAPFYPPDTIHLAVVDPGVGGTRRPLALKYKGQFFVGPDNGIFSAFIDRTTVACELTNPNLWLPNPSATFHGRDLFAPTAARLLKGWALDEFGEYIADPVRLAEWEIVQEPWAFYTAIVHVDHFGNCISALHADRLAELGEGPYQVELSDRPPLPLHRTYSEGRPGEALALVGSNGLIEVAVREGSAAQTLGLRRGMRLRIKQSREVWGGGHGN